MGEPMLCVSKIASTLPSRHLTEELRKAVVHYRVLFDDMLEVRPAEPEILLAKEVELHA